MKLQSNKEWNEQLIISIIKRSKFDNLLIVDEIDLLPPLNFTGTILTPNTLHLEWTLNKEYSKIFYIIYVQQINQFSNELLNSPQNFQVKFYK